MKDFFHNDFLIVAGFYAFLSLFVTLFAYGVVAVVLASILFGALLFLVALITFNQSPRFISSLKSRFPRLSAYVGALGLPVYTAAVLVVFLAFLNYDNIVNNIPWNQEQVYMVMSLNGVVFIVSVLLATWANFFAKSKKK